MGYGPIEFTSDVVSGGWNAIANITSGIGKGAEALISPFFPSPQKKTPILSETVKSAGMVGQTFRPVAKENQSMVETSGMYLSDNFLSSQYAERFNAPAKVAESKALSASVSAKDSDWLGNSLTWALEQSKKISTIADSFIELWGLKPREPISEGAAEIGNSPGTVEHLQKDFYRQAETTKTWAKGFLDQVKGLFGIGYEGPAGGQPVQDVTHEIGPFTRAEFGTIAIVVIALLLLGRK